MAFTWLSTYETIRWAGPGGELGANQYGNAGLNRLGQQVYYIRISDSQKKAVGDLITTSNPADIVGKVLANAIGTIVYSEFVDENGIIVREVDSKTKLDNLRVNPNEPKPIKAAK